LRRGSYRSTSQSCPRITRRISSRIAAPIRLRARCWRSARPGDASLPALGSDIDVRTDCPSYWIHTDGRRSATVPDVKRVWRDDLVSVAIGCWFSMEEALQRAQVRLRHLELGIQGP
jgi:uncharacterized protein YcsI (UPF0317 family)